MADATTLREPGSQSPQTIPEIDIRQKPDYTHAEMAVRSGAVGITLGWLSDRQLRAL